MNHLYIIQSKFTGLIKIGRTNNVAKRLSTLQTGNGYELKILLILNNFGHLERTLHDRLRLYRQQGEWFRYEGICELPDWIYEQLDLEIIETWWR